MRLKVVAMVALAASMPALADQSQDQPPQPITRPAPIPPPPPPLAPPPPNQARPPRPLGNPAEWINADDYPKEAMRAGVEGTVQFRLTVDEQGGVASCAITLSSGSPLLDERTCFLLRERARFTVPLDLRGKPTIGTYANRVRWIRPPNDNETLVYDRSPNPGRVVMEFVIAADGSTRDCRIVGGADVYDLLPMFLPCDWDARYPPYRDAAGNPVDRKVRMVVTVSLPVEAAPVPARQ